MIKRWLRRLTQTQMILIGFCMVEVIGTLLLMLPISTRAGVVTPPVNALFTAVSSSCVTGLVIADTYQYWSTFGQCVILFLIQIGGLGFMTIGVFFAIVLRKKIGLWVRGTLQESVNFMQTGGVVRLAKKIIIGTAIFEGTGAVILHSVSARQWNRARQYITGFSIPYPRSVTPDLISWERTGHMFPLQVTPGTGL